MQDSLPNRRFDSYTFTASASGCTTVTLTSPGTTLYVAAYGAGGYVPATPMINYLADPGTSAASSSFSFNAVGGQNYTIVVHEITASSGATPVNYKLNVSGPLQDACLLPTAANGSIAGRTLSADGASISNAIVILTDGNGRLRSARSNSFGYYRISNIPADFDYVFSAKAKGYIFPSRGLDVTEDMTGVDVIAQ